MIQATPVTIGGKEYGIRYTNRAQYRLSALDGNTDLSDLGKRKKTFAVLVNWLWATLIDCPFAKPEDLAEAIKREDVEGAISALAVCIRESTSEKNDSASASGPSHA
jgi:hypothetical protein